VEEDTSQLDAGGDGLAQGLTADRHGRMLDSMQKLLGAGLGIGAAYVVRWLRRRRPAA
jgi:hypothetical protein